MVLLHYNALRVMYMVDIQKGLLAAFESSGLTYDELAKRTNLPKSALYRYLNGDTEKIPIDRFQSICAELHVDAGQLLGWKECTADSTPSEESLLSSYRLLTQSGKEYLQQQIRVAQMMFQEDEIVKED